MEKFSRDEVFNETLKYFNGDSLATEVWINKYCLKDSDGNLYEKTPADMHKRLAKEFANVEKKYSNDKTNNLSNYGKNRTELTEEKILEYFNQFKYIIPQGSIMNILGNKNVIGSLSNCVVIPRPHDSYGGILYSDQQLAQLFKRRCVSENSFVLSKERGLIKIKDLKIDEHVLSKNIITNKDEYNRVTDKFKTNVNTDDRIIITLSNGTKLHSSKKHPILTYTENGYEYKKILELKINDVLIKPEINININQYSKEKDINDISWFIGHHLGDGNAGWVTNRDKRKKNKVYVYKKVRFRILGNNLECIENYKRIHSALSGSKSSINKSKRKQYISDVWEYNSSNKKNEKIINNYFDKQIGNKTYKSFVPKYIKENNTWIPFLAGLIDADGYVKDGNTIEISLTNHTLIDEISTYLSSLGLYYHVTACDTKRKNENRIYKLLIHYNREFFNNIQKFIIHPQKKNKLNVDNYRLFSHKKYLSEDERNEIISTYRSKSDDFVNKTNTQAMVSLLRKDKNLGLSATHTLLDENIITIEKYNEIEQRLFVTNIENDVETTEYYDIEVEKNNNFYSGNFGLCNIHNCGVGIDISSLRPGNAKVTNAAGTSTGAVSFMERYSNTTREVGQNNRRGALMISIDVRHPDILDFVKIKRDLKKVTGANISIQLRDDFMNAVINNDEYILRFPVDATPENAKYTKIVKAKKIWDEIIKSAHASAEPGLIFKDKQHWYSTSSIYPNWENISTNPCFPSSEYLLTENGYEKFGDLYAAKKNNNIIADGRIVYNDVGQEKPENWKISNNDNDTIIREASNVFLTQNNVEILEVITDIGYSVKCTPDHHFATKRGMIEAKDLKLAEDEILISQPHNENSIVNKKPQSTDEMSAFLIGLVTGDGTFSCKNGGKHNSICIDIWGNDKERLLNDCLNFINYIFENNYDDIEYHKLWKNRKMSPYYVAHNEKNDKIRIESVWLYHFFNQKYNYNKKSKFIVPKFVMSNSRNDIGMYYLAGLFYADGTVNISQQKRQISVRLGQSNVELLKQIQLLLHSNGILSKIYLRNTSKTTKIRGVIFNKKLYYDLITLNGSHVKFSKMIGFYNHPNKELKLSEYVNDHKIREKKSYYSKPIKINPILKNEDVYCVKEDVGRNIIVNGCSVRRCSEIAMNDDSCRLMVVNFFNCVDNPFTDNAKFNYDKLYEVTYEAQRLIDDLVDLELDSVEKIIEKIKSDPEPDHIKEVEISTWENLYNKGKSGRRTGLGFTALGDAIAAMGYKYDTSESIKFIEEIMKTKFIAEFDSSIDMAIQRGKFEGFDPKYENQSDIVKMMRDEFPDLYHRMMKFGRRNISISTVAPTGSLSILTQTTSGIEPLFQIGYIRRRKLHGSEDNIKPDFIDDMGDKWINNHVLHYRVKQWLNLNNYNDLKIAYEKSPYVGSLAQDINWINRVKIQSIVQKYVTHSISSTINLPKDVSLDKVAEIYIESWKMGLKGITVYRDGSRSGVLISDDDKKEKQKEQYFKDNHAPKRPKRLKADIIRFQNNLEKWIAVVGILDGRPYEFFTGRLENGLSELPPSITECEVVKKIVENENGDKVKRYDIEYINTNGEVVIHKGINQTFDPEYWNYAKLISSVMRHGMPTPYIWELVRSLNLNDEHLNTWKAGVERVIKRYIKDGEKTKDTKCPECGGNNLEFKEGCLTCMSCGHSACS